MKLNKKPDFLPKAPEDFFAKADNANTKPKNKTFLMRFKPGIYEKLQQEADETGRSVTKLINYIIETRYKNM